MKIMPSIILFILVSAIKGIFNKSKVIPVIANRKETQEVNSTKNSDMKNEQVDCSPETANRQAKTFHHVASQPGMTGKGRKTPVTGSSDFLW
jgi:regulatory protein YycI of two-component signal transduction system YycFG